MSKTQRSKNDPNLHRPPTRLVLIASLSQSEALAGGLDPALAAGDVASLLVSDLASEGKSFATALRPVIEAAQRRDVAVLLRGDLRLVKRLGADGFHCEGDGMQLREAIEVLQPDCIVGAGRLVSRHQAMEAGEAGADYVFFGNLDGEAGNAADELIERAGWWQDLFVTPCVVLASRLEEVGPLAEAGADFVALPAALWLGAASPAGVVGAAQAAIDGVFSGARR